MEYNQQYPQQPQGSQNQQQQPPVNNGSAIAALVLGILSVVIPYVGFIIGIIAIVISSKALKQIPPHAPGGARGMAIAGLVCGIVGSALYGLIVLLLLIAFLAAGL